MSQLNLLEECLEIASTIAISDDKIEFTFNDQKTECTISKDGLNTAKKTLIEQYINTKHIEFNQRYGKTFYEGQSIEPGENKAAIDEAFAQHVETSIPLYQLDIKGYYDNPETPPIQGTLNLPDNLEALTFYGIH